MTYLRIIDWFVLVLFKQRLVQGWEVAVIIGGEDNKGAEHSDVELFVGQNHSCSPYGNLATYSGAATHMAGVFVPNVGIFVCGGKKNGLSNASCQYYYSPSPHHLAWTKYNYPSESEIGKNQGILDTGLEVWRFEDTHEQGFFQVGGRYPNEEDPSMTRTYKFRNMYDPITEDPQIQLPFPRSGECFVRMQISNSSFVYLAIGGKTVPESAPQISYYYCIKNDCKWANATVPKLEQITGHSCTVFREPDERRVNKDVVLIAGGENNNNKTLKLSYKSCNDSEYTCDWTGRTVMDLPIPLAYSQMVTLNEHPYIFGGNSGGVAVDDIYYYSIKPEVWTHVGRMASSRQHHLVVSVPEIWLCHGVADITPSIPTTIPTTPTTPTTSTTPTTIPTTTTSIKTSTTSTSTSSSIG